MTPGERPLRVLVCSQGFPRHPEDHHATFVLDHARALVAAGADVEVCCPAGVGLPPSDEYPIGGSAPGTIPVRRFRYAPARFETFAYSGGMHHIVRGPKGLLLPFFLLGFLIAVFRSARRVDVVHAHWWLPSGVVAVLARRLVGVPVVVQVHGTDAAMATGPLRPLARWVLRGADAVVAVSDDLAAWVEQTSGVTATVLPMPLRPALADGLTVPPGPPPADGPVVAVGRLVPEKGFDVLVRAVAMAGVPLSIVGEGTQRAPLAALAAEVGADVTFVGPVPPDELDAEYARARVVAVPSRREGFGLVAAEALACGRAVVASRVGGLPQIVDDGVTGALVPADDPGRLAEALRSVDPGLGAAGPASVAWIAPARIGAATVACYRSVLAARSG